MTRDEAIRTMQNIANNHDYRGAEYWADVFFALGILKLDEPKSAAQKFADIAHSLFGTTGYIQLWDSLEKNGLRIVEK